MRYRVLGTTQAIQDDGTPAALGGARLRALVTVLALRAGRTVPVELLVDEVWDGDSPADAAGALQALVGRARRALGHAEVVSAQGGYRLRVDAGDVDLHHFARLAEQGARALAGGDPGRAVDVLDEALALWRGPVLADLPDRTVEAARWETRRLEARRSRLVAFMALGRAREALPSLAALCGEHPLDEPLQALRIRALRAVGRSAEALAAYESVRRELSDLLGTEPGPELRALHAELLAPARVGEPSPRSYQAGQTGLAPARVGEPVPAPVEGPAPIPRGGSTPGNLRARLTSFVGRESDIEAIRGDLRRARLVTLVGAGGAGKTRLSQESADRTAGEYPDGVWLAELAPVGDPDNVPEAVLNAVGARETVLRGVGAEDLWHGGDPLVRLTEHCGRRRMLLVLDNCEHLVAAVAALCERLLEQCPGLTVLATSREPLGVPGEVVRPVGPLPAPMAMRLLADRGAAANPGFRIDADDDTAAAAAEICRRLDGLPLAVELAAARLRLLTPRQIADRLDDRFRLLTSGSRTVLPRQQTLRAVVDWSWELLDEAERTVLRRLAVFARGCDLEAAEAVCALPGPRGTRRLEAPGRVADARDVLPLLGALVDKSLVVAVPSEDGMMRYQLLETVGEYAAERLDEAGDRSEAERAHLVYYRELARRTDPLLRGPGQIEAVARLGRERENLHTALHRATAAGDEDEALCLVLSLAWYWQMRDLRAPARQWSRAVAALGPDPFAAPVVPAEPLRVRVIDTPPPFDAGLREEARRGVRLIGICSMEHRAEDWTTPEQLDRLRGVASAYRPGHPQSCRFPGSLWLYAVLLTGDEERLRRTIDETVRGCAEYGYEWDLGVALQMRANVLVNRGEWPGDARADADRSLGIFERIGDLWGAAGALSARGEARQMRGEFALAAEDFAAAVDRARRLGAESQVPYLHARQAAMLTELGRRDEAEALFRDVLAQTGEGVGEALPTARLFFSMLLGLDGRTAEAREQLDLLAVDFQSETLAFFDGFRLGALAWIDCLDGRYTEALGHVHAALESAMTPIARMVAPNLVATQLPTAAEALARIGVPVGPADPTGPAAGTGGACDGEDGACGHEDGAAADAARLLGAHRRLLPAGHVLTALDREGRERAERAARAVLDDACWAAHSAEGESLTAELAVALVERHVRHVRTSCGTSGRRSEPSPR
ncbi:BTAD domain-containing putative transcriptional regulator [Streptomyces sp. SCSIO 30461]|uniref:AfsR/SARP family transcriptional regulator n=1 Tax=Streptomyces sp. SCSIO 30461 TaxID=3118085 RepID=UPI0030D4ED5E